MNNLKEVIQSALLKFSSGILLNNAKSLLNVLGYESDRTVQLSPNNYEGLAELFQAGPSKFDVKKAKVEEWQSIDIIFQLAEDDIKKSHSLFEAKKVDNTIIESYLFIALSLTGDRYARSDLVKITREINRLTPMPSMILFKYNNYLTLAVIDRRLHKKESSKDVLEKVTLIKDINVSKPHRAHIEILYDLSLENLMQKYPVSNFVDLHNAWRKTLDTKELNKKFYDNLFYWYLWAVKNVKFPQIRPKEDLIPDEAHQSESVIRLLTRLLFCWFMKEKQELIPELLFDKREVKKILKDFSSEKEKSSVYYRAVLQNLFFATLSIPIGNRKYIRESFQGKNNDYGNPFVYRYQNEFVDAKENLKLFKNIPFLNGGLFECLDKKPENDDEKEIRLDGFSSKEKKQAFVPDYLFWDEHKGIDLSKELDNPRKKNETVHGIIDILNSYKFTIEENTPLEEEIALDPELLGKVFESLLAYYNPETKANARKQTGSFYTPREIVNYMVDESLVAAFQQKLGDAGIIENIEPRLHDLISYSKTANPFSEKETNVLIQALENLKVLDPACGSGAFPMGILHKLVWVLQKVDPDNKKWFESIIKRLPDYTQLEMRKKLEGENWDYLRKLGVIQQSIYGVDIQPIAIQIAKLRFFISLLVDQDIKGNGENNFGLQPLPNLDFKLVSANTLIGAPEHNQATDGKLFFAQDEFFDAFSKLTGQYFGTYEPAEKKKLTKKIEKLVSSKVQEKVDEIQRLSTHTDERFSKHVAEKNKSIIKQKKQDAKLWQSYNNLFKHESVEFFETKYFFPEATEGFDVVIGNPPYISVEKFSGTALQEKWKSLYQTYAARGDIYCFFYERGIDLINQHGNLCYISSNKFMRAGYGKGLRKLLASQLIEKVIDFCELPVFSASTDPAIIQLKKDPPDKNSQVFAAVIKEESEIYDLPHALLKRGLSLPLAALKPEGWTIEGQDGLGLIEKLRSKGKPLGEYVSGRLYYGIKTGLNEAFVLDRTTKDQLIKEDPRSAELIHKWIRGKDIKRWRGEWNSWYVIVFPYGFHAELKKYPAILRHLSKFEKDLKERGQCRTSRSGKEEGQHHWLELDNNPKPEYLEAFNKPKIVFNETSKELHAYVDTEGYAINKTGFIILADEPYYVLSVLNSSALDYLYRCEFPSWGDPWKGGRVQFRGDRMAGVPIPVASDEQKRKLTSLAHAATKASGVQLKKIEDEINQIVFKLFGLTGDEIALIESSIPKSESPGGLDNKTGNENGVRSCILTFLIQCFFSTILPHYYKTHL